MVQKVNKTKERAFVLISGLFFIGSLISSLIPMFTQASQPQAAAPVEQVDPLQEQVKGYQIVLQREPNNQIALEGLAKTYLDMSNPQAAIEPLEKLVKLYPDRADYKTQLDNAKQQAGQ